MTFTSTISPKLMQWLNDYTKKACKTKREVIETALKNYQIYQKKEDLRKTFIKANKNNEMEMIAEEGMDDFSDQLHKL